MSLPPPPPYCIRYKRVFSIGTTAITTYNPNTHEVTNQVRAGWLTFYYSMSTLHGHNGHNVKLVILTHLKEECVY